MVLVCCLNEIGKGSEEGQDLFFETCNRSRNGRGIEHRSALLKRGFQRGRGEGQRSVGIEAICRVASRKGDQGFGQEGFEEVPLCIPYLLKTWGTYFCTRSLRQNQPPEGAIGESRTGILFSQVPYDRVGRDRLREGGTTHAHLQR